MLVDNAVAAVTVRVNGLPALTLPELWSTLSVHPEVLLEILTVKAMVAALVLCTINPPCTLPAALKFSPRAEGETVTGPVEMPVPGVNVTAMVAVLPPAAISVRVTVALNGPKPNTGDGMLPIVT